MTLIYPVILKRSEESHKSLLPQSLRFFTSFRMKDKRKDVIGNPLIKQMLYLNRDDIKIRKIRRFRFFELSQSFVCKSKDVIPKRSEESQTL